MFPCYSGIVRSSHDFPWIMYGKTSTSTSPQKTRAKQGEDLTDRVGMSRANTRKTKQQDLANENSNWLVFEIDNRPGYLSRKQPTNHWAENHIWQLLDRVTTKWFHFRQNPSPIGLKEDKQISGTSLCKSFVALLEIIRKPHWIYTNWGYALRTSFEMKYYVKYK